MLFNSLEFVVFFLIVYASYLVLDHRRQNHLLLTASYVFYGAWDWRFLTLLWATTFVDYVVGLLLGRPGSERIRKLILTVSIIANLGVLGTFKYFNFFADSFTELAALFGLTLSPITLKIILPVGVSFYTFQSMSYTIDVYRRRLAPCKKLADFALYVAFFPQLVAGPIERVTRLLPQILQPRAVTRDKIGTGLCLILLGFFKKVVVADSLAPTVDAIFSEQDGFTGPEVLVGTLFFAFQIYCDFSGYTDIARGLSRLLGFELMVNFKQPYFARSPSDFWRRWHISLSSWLRDYLYVPLGGNKHGRWLTYRNLMLTMLLGGLWHGAAWNFVLWGAYHGALLVGYRAFDERINAAGPQARNGGLRFDGHAVAATIIMFAFTLYGWLLFRATSLHQIAAMTSALGDFTTMASWARELVKLVFFVWPVVLLDYLAFRSDGEEPWPLRASVALQTTCYASLIFLFVVLGRYEGASFIYFQF
jgi:D-alanyl-lipoteichoic acid acyltransferase DltB (MBOAT superfamily)